MGAGNQSRRRRWLRWLVIGLLVVSALGVLAAAGIGFALRSPGVQQSILEGISDLTEAEYGFSVAAESIAFQFFPARVEVDRLELTAGEGPPFARIDRTSVSPVALSLVKGPLVLRSVELDRPTVNLGAALPARGDAPPDSTPPESLPLRIGRLRLVGGRLDAPVPDRFARALSGWYLEDLFVEGGFDGSILTLAAVRSDARLERRAEPPVEIPPVELHFESVGEVDLAGAGKLEKLKLSGEAIHVEGAVRLARDWRHSAGWLRLEADPAYLLRGVRSEGITLEGEADLEAWEGRLRLEGRDQPGALIAEALPGDLGARLELDRTDLEVRVDLHLETDGKQGRTIAGQIGVAAAREGEVVLDLEARPVVSLAENLSAQMTTELRLLPGEVGTHTVSARLSAEHATRPESWRIERGRATLSHPRVTRLLEVISGLWPEILADSTFRGLPELGSLDARADLSGALADPEIDGRVELRPHVDGRLVLSAKGRPSSKAWAIGLVGSGLELGHFTTAACGRLELAGEVQDPLGSARGSLELSARELVTESGRLLGALRLELDGTQDRIDWLVDGDLAGGGELGGRGSLRPERPLRSVVGRLDWSTADERMPRVAASFELARGALSAALTGESPARDALEVGFELPLRNLDLLPGVGDLSALPVERSEGPVVLSWRAPGAEWRELLPPELATRIEALRGSSSGGLSIDLTCPSCSTGSAVLAGFGAELDGRLAEATGDLRLELAGASLAIAPWTVRGEGGEIALEGELNLSPDWRFGEPVTDLVLSSHAELKAELESTWLASLPIEITSPGRLTVTAQVTGPLDRLVGSARVAAPGLKFAVNGYPAIELGEPAADLTLGEGTVEWARASLGVNDAELTSEGRAALAGFPADASGTVGIQSGLPVLTSALLPFRIAGESLLVDEGRIATVGGEGSLSFELPMGEGGGAAARARWALPVNDWAPLVARLGGGDDFEALELALRGELSLPMEAPAAAEGQVAVSSGRIVARGRETLIRPGLVLEVGESRLRLLPFELRTASESFRFEARAELDPAWVFGSAPADLVASFDLVGNGDLDAGLFNPFLAGGRAEGSLNLALDLRGKPSAYSGRIRVEGPDASILYRSPYLARFERPRLELSIREGRVALERGDLLLNEGALAIAGQLSGDGGTNLGIRLEDAVFRLDYGLLARLGADLRYRAGDEGSSSISGAVEVERGTLTRNVQLDLDLLSQLLAPIDLTTTEDEPLDLVSLALEVRTREGVRVKNNLGDLLVRWEPLQVTGTLARPVIEGRLEVDPGGLLYAYGQTVRLDRAAIEYPGQEGADPRLDLEVTTSLEDPTIGRLAGDDPFRSVSSKREPASGPVREEITADLARFYGEQFAGRVGESVGVRLSLRPLLIFGETDPGARLTVSRDLSVNLALAASIDLRNAEARTYLLEAHELRQLPRLVGQAFTDDVGAFGGALLQRQSFGGARRTGQANLPRISKIATEPPKGVSRRGIKRALALDKGDPFDPSQRFVAEVELVDYLMRKGYPDARVLVRAVPDERRERRVRLDVNIEPGPFVEFVFEGEKIPKPLRALIRSLYRPDFFEPESIEEVRSETVRALRSRGFLEPVVEIRVEALDPDIPTGDRRVTVQAGGGVELSPDPPIFLGLPPEDADSLNAVFANMVQRVELAVGLPSADRRLLSALVGLGYSEARIATRYQTLEDRVLTVEIEPGPRQRIAGVVIEGVDEELTPEISIDRVRSWLEVAQGDPLRRSRLSGSAIGIERGLQSLGYLEARVRTVLERPDADAPYETAVRFEVAPGVLSRLGEVDFQGLGATREGVARGVADLEIGAPLGRGALSAARTSLWGTGLFRSVGTETIESGPGLQRVIFNLEERERYRLTYGIRWDSEDGMGAVFDAGDDNFLGRGWTLGLRALTSSEEDSVRWLTRVPRAFGGPGSLELFAAVRALTEISAGVSSFGDEVPVDVFEGTLQYSHPLTERSTLRVYGRYTDTLRRLPFLDLRVKNPQLGFQYLYDARSPGSLTERGIFASVDLSGSEELLGGDVRYVRTFSQLNVYRPAGRLFGSRLYWTQAYRVGLAEAFDGRLRGDVRFFAGGEYSVRGYDTESLGDQDFLGAARGGVALLVMNQELRLRLFPDYSIVLFADAGNVWQERGDFGTDLFTSAGLGLRAATPVGLVRLDVARALERRLGIDPEFKIYFGLGATF